MCIRDRFNSICTKESMKTLQKRIVQNVIKYGAESWHMARKKYCDRNGLLEAKAVEYQKVRRSRCVRGGGGHLPAR